MLNAYRNITTGEIVVCSGWQELAKLKERSIIERHHVWWEMRFIPIKWINTVPVPVKIYVSDLFTAQLFLQGTTRTELRDHAFGDREVYWSRNGKTIATGYFSSTSAEVGVNSTSFHGSDAHTLLSYGKLVVERNDSTGPDDYADGKIMDALTLEGVREELCHETTFEEEYAAMEREPVPDFIADEIALRQRDRAYYSGGY